MAVNFRPLSDKVLVKPSEAEAKTSGGGLEYSSCIQWWRQRISVVLQRSISQGVAHN